MFFSKKKRSVQDGYPAGVDIKMAKTLVCFCSRIQEDYIRLSESIPHNISWFIDNKKVGVQVYVFEMLDKIFITFKDSDEWSRHIFDKSYKLRPLIFRKDRIFENFFKHFDFLRRKRVHKDILTCYHEVRKKIIQKSNTPKKIYITGFGVGGALAMICAWDISRKFWRDDIEVYTFGSSKVFNNTSAKKFDKVVKNGYRFELAGDIVCQVMGKQFINCGKTITIDESGKLTHQHNPHLIKRGLVDSDDLENYNTRRYMLSFCKMLDQKN